MFINALKLYLVTLNLLGVKVEFKFLNILKMILLLEKQNKKNECTTAEYCLSVDCTAQRLSSGHNLRFKPQSQNIEPVCTHHKSRIHCIKQQRTTQQLSFEWS